MKKHGKLLIQCDFDGTVTYEDASFAILEKYLPETWQDMFKEYQQGKITLGEFNNRAFSGIRDGMDVLLDLVDEQVTMRKGFPEFLEFCERKRYPIVIVSNGLDFYIRHILGRIGRNDIEVHASITEFHLEGMRLRHKGPDGDFLDHDVKAAYTQSFIDKGYDVVYLGDGSSDLVPARKCSHVFATGPLVTYCRENDVDCTPFDDFFKVIDAMEKWG